MRWIEKAALTGAAVLAMAAAAAQAQVLVVRANGPSAGKFKPGTALAPNSKVALQRGDILVLLDEQSSWSLRGPGTLPVRARQRLTNPPKLMSVNERRARIGAVRTPDAEATTRPNLWLIDVAQPGATCIVDTKAPLLWRADAKPVGKTIITAADGALAQVDWSEGQETAAWPASLPILAGATYHMAGAGAVKDGRIILKPLVPAPASVADAGKALIANGCAAQLDLLVVQMTAAGNQPGG